MRDTRRHRRLLVMGNMTYSRTIECAPPQFGHTIEHTLPMDLRVLSSRSSVPAITLENSSSRTRSVDEDLAVRLTWLAYAVALSSFGLVLGVAIGLLLVPSAPVAFVRM